MVGTRVYLIRHADVENPRRVLYGHIPGFSLSRLGRAQAVRVGESLRGAGLRRIVHSPLDRAVETANLIADQISPRPRLIADPALREAEMSRHLQGLPYWQIPLKRPLWYVHKIQRGRLSFDEPISELGGRILRVVRDLVRQHPGEASAIVSHADPLQAAWILLDGRPHNEREMYRKTVNKAGLLIVDHDDAGQVVGVEYVEPPKVEPDSVRPGAEPAT